MNRKSLWQTLWDYDPNGLVVVTPDLLVTLVNPAFCSLFKVEEKDVVGYPLTRFFDDTHEFQRAWSTGSIIPPERKLYERYSVFVRRLIFPIPDEKVIAAIFVNLTDEWKKLQALETMKQHVLDEVSSVVNEQIRVAQHIAQLLGESTAKSHISLRRLAELVQLNKL